jgi:ferredoxin
LNTRRTLSKANLEALVHDLITADTTVIVPARFEDQGRRSIEYRAVRSPEEMDLDGSLPRRSLKEVVFPATDELFRWRQTKSLVQIEEIPASFKETVVVGARPCDAAALEILDQVMGWDYKDELWFGRRNATTVLSVACSDCDESCFCTAVGLSPTSRRGADWFLTPVDGGFEVEVLTPKGEALLERYKTYCPEATGPVATGSDAVERKVRANLDIPLEKVRNWLGTHFDDTLWKRIAMRCHGCGACAFVCPTCHCFDIVDEPQGVDCGVRRRNWDACQAALFTVHGSGHNPRRDQTSRYRQRILHKFSIYPSKFGDVLCTGCGRCVRVCAAGMDLVEILGEVGHLAVVGEA